MHFKQTIVGMSKTESMAQQSLELVSEVASLSARAGPSKEAQPTRLVGRCGLPPAVGVSVVTVVHTGPMVNIIRFASSDTWQELVMVFSSGLTSRFDQIEPEPLP